jgi:hypothetical protein
VARRDRQNFVHTLGCDVSPAPRVRFRAAFERQRHTFQQTSVGHVGKGMTVENAAEIWSKAQAGGYLPQAASEDTGARGACRRKIFGVAGIAYQRAGCDPLHQ